MTHPAFEHIRSESVPSLNIEVQEYRHTETGARHFHLAADDNNNAFLVAFLTVPQDSTGVAHILEHTSLCGSERFPVRDPFFMMTRRSLNTFMNAFTSSDWTAYPFATQNRKDFDNLLQVYLDAVFFPKLDELDFAQEGHRVEFAESDNPDSPLEFKGVVFNEMKGAMSSPVNQLWHSVQSKLFPTITYHYNSGGDPEEIPNLSWEQLKAFHARHYHPSNAIFITYGDIPAEEHQRRFQELALGRFRRLEMDLSIPDEQRYAEPVAAEASYTLDGEEDTRDKTHVVLGWLLGHSADMRAAMEANLLSGVLLDNSASPLRHALETTELGTAPSELCGVDDSNRETTFYAGVEGSNPEQAQAVEDLVLGVLRKVAEEGVPQEQVASVLHQLELSQREITGGRFPYGLRLMVNTLPPVLHGGDPVAALNIDPVLEEMRQRIQDPEFIKGLVRRLLLDNPHRVRLTMVPDTGLSARKARREMERLAAMKAAMSEEDKRRVIERAQALAERQQTVDDPEVLPRVGLEDVPPDLRLAEGSEDQVAGMQTDWYAQGTNGIVYHKLVVDLPALDDDLVDLLPLFCDCMTEVGVGGQDYLAIQKRQAAVTGGLSASANVRGAVDDVQSTRGLFVISGKALARNHRPMLELLVETFQGVRFDEHDRLRELVAQIRAHRESSVTDHGHSLAMGAASAGLSPSAALSHRWGGLAGLRSIKALDDSLGNAGGLESLADKLVRIHRAVLAAPRRLLVVAEEKQFDAIRGDLDAVWSQVPAVSAVTDAFRPPTAAGQSRQGWATSTQVNFCAKAYATVAVDHPHAAALTVLGPFLRNTYLHRAIREQGGAYGGGAGYDSDSGAFRFFSYRDPRLEGTLDDFDACLDWLAGTDHDPRTLEEAILNVISSIDRPESPAGEAISAYFGKLYGRTAEQRRQFRQRVLKVTIDDLRQVAETYLKPELGSVAVLSDARTLEEHAGLGLEVIQL
jgi:Zn-dependent M16 (insulinase) family peptidase